MVVSYAPRPFDSVNMQWVAGAESEQVASFEEPFARVYSSIERDYSERVRTCEERQRLSFVTGADAQTADGTAGHTTGRVRWARLNEALNGFGLTRSKNQRWFHRRMSMAIIRKLFKDDFAENLDFLREQFEVDQFKSEVMIITPRRWGKTYSVAMFVAACAYALENTTQAIFSTGRRASKKLLDLIYQMLCKLPGMRESIITKNVEEIRIQGPGGIGDVRTICSYPSKCRAWYTEKQSIGTQRCRRHTGMLQSIMTVYGGTMDTYSCCGKSPFGWHAKFAGDEWALGCVSCDHTDEPGLPENISMPLERAEVIFDRELLSRNVVYDDRTSTLTILRRAPALC